jgi:hypothetical protein
MTRLTNFLEPITKIVLLKRFSFFLEPVEVTSGKGRYKDLGPYSQHFIFYGTYEWAQ